jgi:hypothetical protein
MEKSKMLRRLVVATMLITAGMATAGTAAAAAPTVVPPNQNVVGMTPSDWSAAWWQYVLQIPADINPATDTSGANCGVDQAAGPAFFLTGNFTSNATVTRNCRVPAGKVLVIPIINTECSSLEAPPYYGGNEKELRACAAASADFFTPASLVLTIDGVNVPNLQAYRVQSPVFDFHMPAKNVLGLKSGKKIGTSGTAGVAVSDGYWVITEPLAAGVYTIRFAGSATGPFPGGFALDVTYVLTVVAADQAGIQRPKLAARPTP